MVLLLCPVAALLASVVVGKTNALSTTTPPSSPQPRTIEAFRAKMQSKYEQLADRALNLHASSASTGKTNQIFIGVAGGPGSGKSTLATSVASILNERSSSSSGESVAVVLPMDGYHIPRSELRHMGSLQRQIGDRDSMRTNGEYTTYEDLLARRGSPWTFDAQSLIRDFTEAKRTGKAILPTYSRTKSDPVPGGVTLTPKNKIVLCEGNYLCAFDDQEWKPLKELWDDIWYVSVPEEIVLDRLVNRHLETWTEEKSNMWGEGKEGAKAKAMSNDLRNAVWIEGSSKKYADIVIDHY